MKFLIYPASVHGFPKPGVRGSIPFRDANKYKGLYSTLGGAASQKMDLGSVWEAEKAWQRN